MGTAISAPTRAARAQRDRRVVTAVYGVLTVVVAGYLASLLLRGAGVYWTWLDGWVVVGVELAASVACLLRARTAGTARAIPLVLGIALLAWTCGDAALTAQSIGGATAPSPSVADAFYLCFYPFAYVATVQLLRSQLGRLSRPNWLDGAVVGLGAAALCASFVLRDASKLAGGGAVSTAVNLAYPVGDLLLLFLVVGGSALLGRGRREMWFLLASGMALNVVGDTFNLLGKTAGATAFGSDFNAIAWPASIVLMSGAMWLRPTPRDATQEDRTSGIFLPLAGSVVALLLLSFGTQRHLSETAIGLALATLCVAGLRLSLSARDLRLLTEHRHRQAMTDELTGLGNRRRLTQVLEGFFTPGLDSHTDARLAFLFVDLNHFKEINDSFGHPAGDELLRQVGPRLAGAVRASDTVMRLGGDEFGVVLGEADATEATLVAQRIADSLREPFLLDEVRAEVGVSIGIALCPNDATDPTGLLWCADAAMYRAKLGRVPYACYDDEVDGHDQQLQLVDELRVAVERGELEVHYQPQLDLRSGHVTAVEALVRWPHPLHGMIPPLRFLPLAEDAGLMDRLTDFVLDTALGQCARWRASGREVSVSVNVSPTNLLADGFCDVVGRKLFVHGLPGSVLVLEITETTILRDVVACQAAVSELRDLGVIVSIDDFGSGFTSLAHLGQLAVRELKLDRSLITGLSGSEDGRELELVRATIDLGHTMGLRVVAEGIEDEPTLALLRSLGCDLAQGFLISRPVRAEDLALRPTVREALTTS